MEQRTRFYVALAIYAVLGLAIWMTIDDIVIPVSVVHITLRQLTLAILGLFVLRTVLHWRAELIRAERERKQSSS
jgi:biotin transporter BioY